MEDTMNQNRIPRALVALTIMSATLSTARGAQDSDAVIDESPYGPYLGGWYCVEPLDDGACPDASTLDREDIIDVNGFNQCAEVTAVALSESNGPGECCYNVRAVDPCYGEDDEGDASGGCGG